MSKSVFTPNYMLEENHTYINPVLFEKDLSKGNPLIPILVICKMQIKNVYNFSSRKLGR